MKKIALIVEHNPDWRDLSDEWGRPIEPLMRRSCGHPDVSGGTDTD